MALLSMPTTAPVLVGETDGTALLPMLGHELRVPLTALKGQLQLMQRRMRREAGRETDLDDLQRAAYQVERLSHQLDIIIDAAHLARGHLDLRPVMSDLAPLITRMVASQRTASSRHQVSLEMSESTLIGAWDETRVSHVLREIIANAIRFSPRGGHVQVHAVREGRQARVEVADEGIGVPEDERESIFEYGTRAANTANFGGAGLGLYVARQIIVRHGGAIGVAPAAGGGSVFWFTLPLT
jgi:signal transduction histidine kinase